MSAQDLRKRILAAYTLLQEETTTSVKFESIRTLIKGVTPKIDDILDKISKTHADLSKLKQQEYIELTAEHLSENSEEEKRRKKALLLFIRYWKQLRSEVERVRAEFEKENQGDVEKSTNILAAAKGPLGLITIGAVIIVAVGIVINSQKTQKDQAKTSASPSPKQKIKVIDFNGRKIPLSELTTGVGPECTRSGKPAEHYHALNHTEAKALDGSPVSDPGGCGFGKVGEVKIEEIGL